MSRMRWQAALERYFLAESGVAEGRGENGGVCEGGMQYDNNGGCAEDDWRR